MQYKTNEMYSSSIIAYSDYLLVPSNIFILKMNSQHILIWLIKGMMQSTCQMHEDARVKKANIKQHVRRPVAPPSVSCAYTRCSQNQKEQWKGREKKR